MPSTAKSDADCIQSAYEDALENLFKVLVGSLTRQPGAGGDQNPAAEFTAGYNLVKHAKALALGVVGPSTPMIAAAAMKKRSAAKRKAR